MEIGQWFKAFGHSPREEEYFEVVAVHGEKRLTLEHICYSPLYRRITRQERLQVDYKEWLESIAKNDVFEITSDQVPFLMAF
ncbi:MAG: hypothetical protein ACOC45_07780 [Alkalispirochaetaceae bacterium]